MKKHQIRSVTIAFFTVLTIGLGSSFLFQTIRLNLSNSEAAPAPSPSLTPSESATPPAFLDNIVPHDEYDTMDSASSPQPTPGDLPTKTYFPNTTPYILPVH